MEIVVYGILLEITKTIQFLTRKFLKTNFFASFPIYFLFLFLVNENLASKYEQLLILTDIDGFIFYIYIYTPTSYVMPKWEVKS